jgi:hypothetical protein
MAVSLSGTKGVGQHHADRAAPVAPVAKQAPLPNDPPPPPNPPHPPTHPPAPGRVAHNPEHRARAPCQLSAPSGGPS